MRKHEENRTKEKQKDEGLKKEENNEEKKFLSDTSSCWS